MPPPGPPPSGRSKEKSTEDLIMSVIGLAVCLISTLLITFVIKFKKLREKKSNQLLLNLCMGHLLTGLTYFVGMFPNFHTGPFKLAGHVYTTAALIFISIDRFTFIKYPFRYSTSEACKSAHIGFMVTSPLVYAVYFADALHSKVTGGKRDEYLNGSFVYIFFTAVTILFVLNLSIYITMRKQQKIIQTQHNQVARNKKSSFGKKSRPRTLTMTSKISTTMVVSTLPTGKLSSNTDSTTNLSPPTTNLSPPTTNLSPPTTNLSSPITTLPNAAPTATSKTTTIPLPNVTPINPKPKDQTSISATNAISADSASPESSTSTNQATSNSEKQRKLKERKKEARSFYLCFGCVATFILLMSPSIIVRILTVSKTADIPKTYYQATLALAGLNPSSDLFTFVWFNLEIRKTIMRTILRKRIYPLD